MRGVELGLLMFSGLFVAKVDTEIVSFVPFISLGTLDTSIYRIHLSGEKESQWFLALVLLPFQTLQIADVDALAICFFKRKLYTSF
jgi:hypothetical protein